MLLISLQYKSHCLSKGPLLFDIQPYRKIVVVVHNCEKEHVLVTLNHTLLCRPSYYEEQNSNFVSCRPADAYVILYKKKKDGTVRVQVARNIAVQLKLSFATNH